LEEIDRLTGQMIVAGFKGKRLPRRTARALSEGRIGGVVLFRENIGDVSKLRGLIKDIYDAAGETPPFVAVDQEGGRVFRLGPPFTGFPPLRALGNSGSEDLAFRMGKTVADELRAVGFNLDFAPVLDVDSNPANPIIGDRSIGSDPGMVSRLGRALIKGMQAGGILACGKHFPGHGDTSADSHIELPVVEADRDVLEKRELIPFRDAVASDVDMIMTAHVRYPVLDRYHPATLSELIIERILRGEMGFKGTVISDDLEMKALSDMLPIEDMAFMAVRAGVDILLVGHDPALAERARKALVLAVKNNVIPFGRIHDANSRIISLKEKIKNKFSLPSSEEMDKIVGSDEHMGLAEEIASFA
jgi:beta-N-acetylhexosaminidase